MYDLSVTVTCLQGGHALKWHWWGSLSAWWQSEGALQGRAQRGGRVVRSRPHATTILVRPHAQGTSTRAEQG